MSHIHIAKIDHGPLEFEGELLVRTLSESDAQGRHYVISIYRMDGEDSARYVPAIQYFSEVPIELSFTIAEVVEDAAEVEKFFYVFEPLEHLRCRHIETLSADARQEFTQRLFQLYDRAVAIALGKFQASEAAPEQESSANTTQAVRRP